MGTEIDYNELFGVEGAELEDETVTDDVTETGDEFSDSGDSDSGDSAEDISEGTDDGNENSDDDSEGSDGENVQSAEDNKRYAAARRKAEKERDVAIAKAKDDAKAEADRYIDEAVKSMGIKNPLTGKLIETKAEWDEYNSKMAESRKDEFIKRSGMSEEEYRRFVDGLPEVAAAKVERERAEAARIEADRNRAKAAMDEEVKKISKLDSSIKTVEDITKLDNYSQIYERVKRGYSLYDAFLSVNHARISEKGAAAAKQKALNSMSGKEHLVSTSTHGSGAESVPNDIAEAYREFNPKATDAEILKHYNKYLKGKG